MTTMTQIHHYPLLVSEVPPAAAMVPAPRRGAARRAARAFEQALRTAEARERVDLLASSRRGTGSFA